MAVSDYSTIASANTTIGGINIAEGCPARNLNDAIRQLMADAKGASWGLISVAEKGAVGDDTTDCTAAFNTAIAQANSAGGYQAILVPAGKFKITGALTPITADHVAFIGISNSGSVLNLSYNGPTFTWKGYGGGLENVQIRYPSAPGANAVVLLQDAGNGQNLKNLRVDNVRTLVQMGTAGGSVGGAVTVSGVNGNAYNGGSGFLNLYQGAGLFVLNCGVYVKGVNNPTVDRTSTMTTVSGTTFIKTNGKSFDTIVVDGASILERWWRVLDFTTTVGGGNVINTFIGPTTICDYIADDVYHLEAPSGAGVIIDVQIAGYASTWSGRAVSINAGTTVGDIDVNNLFIPFSGYEGIRIAGTNWRDIRLNNPKVIGSNRIAAGASAGIRIQDSGVGHLSIIGARSGIDGTAGGTPWQATYGISVAADMNNITVADCDCQGATGFYNFATNSSPSGNRRIRDNINADYAGFQSSGIYTTPANGVNWVNTTGFEIDVYIEGGSLTSIRKNAVLTGLTAGMLTVLPGDYFTLFGTVGNAHFYVKP